jgi:uncharacterized protein YecT (DUF1311 family)
MVGMRTKSLFTLAFASIALASCSAFSETNCSDDSSKGALESAIREGLEKVALERAQDDDGNYLISASSVRASVAKVKLILEDIRTTKEDPDSTKRFCTGTLKIVFSPETFKSADAARELLGLPKIANAIDDAEMDKGADYLKGSLDYSVQPTDDGEKVFAEFERSDGKLDIFGEVVAASLLRDRIENKIRVEKQEAELARKQEEEAVQAMLNAGLEAAVAQRKASQEAIGVVWNSIDADVRKQLLAQQRAWIKQKDAACRVEGLQYSTEPTEQKTAEANCQARENNNRANQLSGYIPYEEGY